MGTGEGEEREGVCVFVCERQRGGESERQDRERNGGRENEKREREREQDRPRWNKCKRIYQAVSFCCEVITAVMLYVSDANHSRSISITEFSLCTPKVIILSRNHTDFNMADQHAGPLHMTCSMLN